MDNLKQITKDFSFVVLVKEPTIELLSPSVCIANHLPHIVNSSSDVSQPGMFYLLDDSLLNSQDFETCICPANSRAAVVIDAHLPLRDLIDRMLVWKISFSSVYLLAGVSDSSISLQQLLFLGFDGFVFNHIDDALSEQLSHLYSFSPNTSHPLIETLNEKRKRINDIDFQLVQLLAERTSVVKELAAIKKEVGMTALQPARWTEVVQDALFMAHSNGVSETLMMDILEAIHLDAVEQQLKH